MISKMMYTCELCGTTYTNQTECVECEESHVKVKKIVKCRFVHINNMPNYPVTISVLMEDGETITYKR